MHNKLPITTDTRDESLEDANEGVNNKNEGVNDKSEGVSCDENQNEGVNESVAYHFAKVVIF